MKDTEVSGSDVGKCRSDRGERLRVWKRQKREDASVEATEARGSEW